MSRFAAALFTIVLVGCGARQANQPGGSASLNPAADAAIYVPRVGVAVTTQGRTCVAIRNANLALNSPVTLVMPNLPQSFVAAQIGAVSEDACPITKEVDRSVTSYELHLPGGTGPINKKLTPMIAVVGGADPFLLTNAIVEADLQGDRKHQMFRSCSAEDGIHLTMWSGTPVTGTLLWHGYYYEPSNPGVGPACVPQETKGP